MFEGFETDQLDTGDASIFVRYAGSGPATLLLHGHPRTSATWHRVAPLLVDAGFRVVCPDLRGYGRSTGPTPHPDHSAHSKRAVARDMLAVMRALDEPRFSLVGHDRGSYVALRLALDHPEAIDRIALLDCVPISELVARTDAAFATAWWHWFFFAQPEIPERVIALDPEAWYAPKADPATMGAENHEELLAAVRRPEVVRAMLEDYRAGLSIDLADERADRAAGRAVEPPLLVLWSLRDDLEQLVGDPLTIWKDWARDVRGRGIASGHHMAEEAPAELAGELAAFFS
jgi:haloacetate dehalogenase